MNLWQKMVIERRAWPVMGPECERLRVANPFVVTRFARGGLHGWESETVRCPTREEADRLFEFALTLSRTIDAKIDDWSGGQPIRVRFAKRAARRV